MKTLRKEAADRMSDAPGGSLEENAIFDLVNAPIMQYGFMGSVAGIEKQIRQEYVKENG